MLRVVVDSVGGGKTRSGYGRGRGGGEERVWIRNYSIAGAPGHRPQARAPHDQTHVEGGGKTGGGGGDKQTSWLELEWVTRHGNGRVPGIWDRGGRGAEDEGRR
jgi:hypothetical protein